MSGAEWLCPSLSGARDREGLARRLLSRWGLFAVKEASI